MLIHYMDNCYIASKQLQNIAHSEIMSTTLLQKTALRVKMKFFFYHYLFFCFNVHTISFSLRDVGLPKSLLQVGGVLLKCSTRVNP